MVVLLLVIVGGGLVAWYFIGRSQVPGATTMVPARTLFFAHIPDGVMLGASYENSQLKQMVETEEIKGSAALIWAQAMEQMPPDVQQDMEKVSAMMEKLGYAFTGESFLALTDINFEGGADEPVGVVMGMHPHLTHTSFDDFIADLKQLIDEAETESPKPTFGQGSYNGYSYEYMEPPGEKGRIYVARTGSWILITLQESLLHETLDRLAGKGNGPSLKDSPEYQAVMSQFKPAPQIVTYVNGTALMNQIINMMDQTAAMSGMAQEEVENLKSLMDISRKFKGLGFGSTFDGNGLLRDQWVIDVSPDLTSMLGGMVEPCAFKTLRYTDKSTILYMANAWDGVAYYNMIKSMYENMPEVSQSLAQLESGLQANGKDIYKDVLEPMGNEYALVSSWPEAEKIPFIGYMLTMKNGKAYDEYIQMLIAMLSEYKVDQDGIPTSPGRVLNSELGNYKLYTYQMADYPMISPTLVAGDDLIAIFLSQKGAATVLSSNETSNFTQFDAWKDLGLSTEGGTQLVYADMKEILDRAYGEAAPFLQMMMMMSPEMQQQLGPDFQFPDKLKFLEYMSALGVVTVRNGDSFIQTSVSTFGSPYPIFIVGSISFLQELGKRQNEAFTEIEGSLEAEEEAATEVADPSAMPGGTPEPEADPKSAKAIRDELNDVRAVTKAWAAQNNVPEGATVEWSSIETFFIPDSRLANSGGKDALGNPFKLGRVGEIEPDVSYETKNTFPDLAPGFWKGTPDPSPETSGQDEAPTEESAQ